MSEASKGASEKMLYSIDDRPPLKETVVLGFQHYLTMFGSTVAIPLLMSKPLGLDQEPAALGWLIGTMFFISGITTLLQTTWGNRLPIVQGGTFSFLAPAMAICGMAGVAEAGYDVRLQHVQGAVIIGARVRNHCWCERSRGGACCALLDPLPSPRPLPSSGYPFSSSARPSPDNIGGSGA